MNNPHAFSHKYFHTYTPIMVLLKHSSFIKFECGNMVKQKNVFRVPKAYGRVTPSRNISFGATCIPPCFQYAISLVPL